MLIQNVKCPYGCENSTLTESIKEVKNSPNNLLLEGINIQKIKVYTCNCCNRSFETPLLTENKKNLLLS